MDLLFIPNIAFTINVTFKSLQELPTIPDAQYTDTCWIFRRYYDVVDNSSTDLIKLFWRILIFDKHLQNC